MRGKVTAEDLDQEQNKEITKLKETVMLKATREGSLRWVVNGRVAQDIWDAHHHSLGERNSGSLIVQDIHTNMVVHGYASGHWATFYLQIWDKFEQEWVRWTPYLGMKTETEEPL